MKRFAVRYLRVLAALLLVFAIPGTELMEMAADCGFALEASAGGACVHGDGDHEDDAPTPCPIDHHGGARCGCTCHHVGLLASTGRLAAAVTSSALHARTLAQLPSRSDRPVLRPPIA